MKSKSKISNKKNPIHPESRSSFESVRSMRNQANNIKTETETFSRIWDKKRGKTYPFLKKMKRFLFNFFYCFLPFFYLPNSVGNKLVSFLFSLCETDLTKTRKRKRRTKTIVGMKKSLRMKETMTKTEEEIEFIFSLGFLLRKKGRILLRERKRKSNPDDWFGWKWQQMVEPLRRISDQG